MSIRLTHLGIATLLMEIGSLRFLTDPDSVMMSTPLDKYEGDVYEFAEHVAKGTGLEYSKKKNRVMFLKEEKFLNLLGI